MKNLSLHKLRLLSIGNVDCMEGFPWSKNTLSSSLQRVQFVRVSYYNGDIIALTKNCSKIRSFSCEGIRIADIHLKLCLGNRLELVNLRISGNSLVSDDTVLFAVQNLPYLRTLNIQECEKLTVMSLSYIAEHASNLEVLYVDVKEASTETERVVEEFSQKCTSVAYLNIKSKFILCTTTCTSSLLEGCPALHTLVINTYENITPTTRKLCAHIKPQFKILVHDKSTEYNVLTLPIEKG